MLKHYEKKSSRYPVFRPFGRKRELLLAVLSCSCSISAYGLSRLWNSGDRVYSLPLFFGFLPGFRPAIRSQVRADRVFSIYRVPGTFQQRTFIHHKCLPPPLPQLLPCKKHRTDLIFKSKINTLPPNSDLNGVQGAGVQISASRSF
jgi:hypothetical protein